MQRHKALSGVFLVMAISACQAPLKLEGFTEQSFQPVQRYDVFQDAETSNGMLVVVGSNGVVLEKAPNAEKFTRHKLVSADGSLPDFINLTKCPSGTILALSFKGALWSRSASGEWSEGKVNTQETVQDLACANNDEIFVSASFSSLLKSEDGGGTWDEITQNEDIMFTQLEFPNGNVGYAFGEFGTVLKTEDSGRNWIRLPDIGPEFYPLASHFQTSDLGWVAGLAGAIYQTQDGGQTWVRELSDTQAPIYKIASIGSNIVAAGNYGTFLERDTTGAWQTKTSSALGTSGYLRVVSTIPSHPHQMLVAGQGYLNTVDIKDLSSVGVQ